MPWSPRPAGRAGPAPALAVGLASPPRRDTGGLCHYNL